MSQVAKPLNKKVLFVLTSHEDLGKTGHFSKHIKKLFCFGLIYVLFKK